MHITEKADLLYEFDEMFVRTFCQTVMPDDHSKLVPLLPIPNRTVKRLCADDSAGSRVKVGHRQAIKKTYTQSETGCNVDFCMRFLNAYKNL